MARGEWRCTTSVGEGLQPAAFNVRALTGADLAAYKALRDRMLEAHPDAFTSDAASERAKPAASLAARLGSNGPDATRFTLGAFGDAMLLGAISCECDARPKVRHIGHLIGMMVVGAVRGQGIGRALLDACIARARGAGLEMLTLSVTAGNAPASSLYLRAGFVRYGSLPRAIKQGGSYLDKDLMLLDL